MADKIVKNSYLAITGNLAYVIAQWLMIVLLAKFGSVSMVGLFAYALSVTAPIFQFSNMQLRSILTSDVCNVYLFRHYFILRVFLSSLSCLIVSAFVICTGEKYQVIFVVMIMAFVKGIESLSDIYWGLFQKYERADLLMKSLVIKGVLSVIITGFILYNTHELMGCLVGIMLAYIIQFMLFDVKCGHILSTKFENRIQLHGEMARKKTFGLLYSAFPLGMASLLGSLYINIPRYYVNHDIGQYYLGVYAALSYVTFAINITINSIGQVMMPSLARYYNNRRKDLFVGLILKIICYTVVAIMIIIVASKYCGEFIIDMIYGKEYSGYTNMFIVLLVASIGISIVSIMNYAFTSIGVRGFQLLIAVFGIAVLSMLSYYLIPRYGLIGAAFAMLFASFAQCVLSGLKMAMILKTQLI